jgi:predicted DNA-binding protein with PD1-like motif
MSTSLKSSLTRRSFFAKAAVAATVPSFTMACLAAAPVDHENSDSPSPDLPAAAVLIEGQAPVYLLVFHTGQEVMKGLLAFAKQHELVAGSVTGIGALSSAIIGYFDPTQNAYLRNPQNEQVELVSLVGNLAMNGDEPFFHIHVGLGRRDGSARGGHLFEAIVRPTVELILTTSSHSVRREIDRTTGLPLLDPSGKGA